MIVQTLEKTDSNIEEENTKIQESNEAQEKDEKKPMTDSEEVPASTIGPEQTNLYRNPLPDPEKTKKNLYNG